jgi:DNA modification methylase
VSGSNNSQKTTEELFDQKAIPWYALTRARVIDAGDELGLHYHLDEIEHELTCLHRRYAWLVVGDNRKVLPVLEERYPERFGGGVTSPPYFGLRDNGCGAKQIGLGKFDDYIGDLDCVNRHVNELLKPDASFWVQIGDKSAGGGNGKRGKNSGMGELKPSQQVENKFEKNPGGYKRRESLDLPGLCRSSGRRVGFWNPTNVVWDKGNPAPRSCKTCIPPSSERIIWLTKSDKWYLDRERLLRLFPQCTGDVWRFPPSLNKTATKYKIDHSSTYPPELAAACLAASCRPSDWIIDPFGGLGNTALGALLLGNNPLLIEQNPQYAFFTAHTLHGLPANHRPHITIILTKL